MFSFNSEDNQKAVLQYDYDGKIIDLYHTGVPPAFRGKGVAKLLAKVQVSFIRPIHTKRERQSTGDIAYRLPLD